MLWVDTCRVAHTPRRRGVILLIVDVASIIGGGPSRGGQRSLLPWARAAQQPKAARQCPPMALQPLRMQARPLLAKHSASLRCAHCSQSLAQDAYCRETA